MCRPDAQTSVIWPSSIHSLFGLAHFKHFDFKSWPNALIFPPGMAYFTDFTPAGFALPFLLCDTQSA